MHKEEQGFSLVELLFIVMIIGILASIAIPTYNAIKQSAYENTVRQNVRDVSLACESYYAEFQKYPVFGPYTGLQGSSNFNITPHYTIKLSEGVTIHSVLLPHSLDIIGTHRNTSPNFKYIRHLNL